MVSAHSPHSRNSDLIDWHKDFSQKLNRCVEKHKTVLIGIDFNVRFKHTQIDNQFFGGVSCGTPSPHGDTIVEYYRELGISLVSSFEKLTGEMFARDPHTCVHKEGTHVFTDDYIASTADVIWSKKSIKHLPEAATILTLIHI